MVVITLFGLEIVLRLVAHRLPLPMLLFLHADLKANLPAVETRIERENPWTARSALDPDVGWTFEPDMLAEGINEDGEAFSVKTSSQGFLTPDQPNNDTPQIVVLGDSFLSTFYVTKPIAYVLRDELNLPVYNLAVGGWGPESYRSAYNKFAKDRNAQIVLVFSFNNDITDVDNWHRWKASGSSLPFRVWLWQSDPSIVNLNNSWIDRHSILWNLSRLSASKIRYSEYNLTGVFQGEKQNREYFSTSNLKEGFELQFTKGYQFMYLDPENFMPGGSYEAYMKFYYESLERLHADIIASDSEMLLIWIPTKERVYLPLLPEARYRQFITNPSGEIDGLEQALHRYAKEQNIPFIDLTPELIRRAQDGQKLYFTVDGHLNSLGNQVVGKLVASAIREFLEDLNSQ